MEQETYMAQEEIFETGLQIDSESKTYLREAAKWARFLGILGFIGSGFILLFILIFSYSNSNIINVYENTMVWAKFTFGTVMFIYYLAPVAGFLISLAAFRFGQRTSSALISGNQTDFRNSMSSMRFIFRLYGIFSIVYLILMILLVFLSIKGDVI